MSSAMESQKNKISEDLRTSRENSDHIPLDLILEILKASTVETLARFLCVSKEYKSIIRNQDFMKLYLIKSLNHPQSLIFTFKGDSSLKHFFFSASHPQYPGSSSSSSLLATYHMKCHSQPYTTVAPSVHGLICYGPPSKLKIYNPSTRKTITLPKIDRQRIDMHHYLGYDPIDGDYKVLCMVKNMMITGLAQEFRILTLGNGNSWSMVEDFPPHYLKSPDSPEICIDGVLYYVALLGTNKGDAHAIISFDVRSGKIDLIKGLDHGYCNPKLTNYQGKLGVLFSIDSYKGRFSLWVLEDAAKHEWSKNFYVLPTIDGNTYYCFHPLCVTNGGEIVLAREIERAKPFYVLYYHPKKNSVRRMYVEGITDIMDPFWDKDLEHDTISVFSGCGRWKQKEDTWKNILKMKMV